MYHSSLNTDVDLWLTGKPIKMVPLSQRTTCEHPGGCRTPVTKRVGDRRKLCRVHQAQDEQYRHDLRRPAIE